MKQSMDSQKAKGDDEIVVEKGLDIVTDPELDLCCSRGVKGLDVGKFRPWTAAFHDKLGPVLEGELCRGVDGLCVWVELGHGGYDELCDCIFSTYGGCTGAASNGLEMVCRGARGIGRKRLCGHWGGGGDVTNCAISGCYGDHGAGRRGGES